jgi:hypothetical protein
MWYVKYVDGMWIVLRDTNTEGMTRVDSAWETRRAAMRACGRLNGTVEARKRSFLNLLDILRNPPHN